MMKSAYVVGLMLFCTTSVMAGIGETKDEALKRYGEPSKWDRDAPPPTGRGLNIAEYSKENPPCKVYFYDDKAGKSISGAIVYELPQDKKLRESIIKKILENNADGKSWSVIKGTGTGTGQDSYQRDGAKASYFNENWLSVSLNDFDAYVSAANKRIADKQAVDKQAADKQAADKLMASKQATVKQAAPKKTEPKKAEPKKAAPKKAEPKQATTK